MVTSLKRRHDIGDELDRQTVNQCGIDCDFCPSRIACQRWHGNIPDSQGKVLHTAYLQAQNTFKTIRPMCVLVLMSAPVFHLTHFWNFKDVIGRVTSN